MAKPKFNLMETLNAVSRDNVNVSESDTGVFKPQMISVHNLIPSADNFYDTSDVTDLKNSIELLGGIKQNLIVKPSGTDKYEIISGHRRHKACTELVAEGKARFEFLPCIVEDGKDPLFEKLLLIMTNSTARELSDFEKCRQAEQLKTLLTELKRRDNIPGRVRDLVAQALNVSESQVARYDAINANLADEVKSEFASGSIPVSVAYEVSKKTQAEQAAAVEEYKAAKTDAKTDKAKPHEQAAAPETVKPKMRLVYVCSPYRGMPPYKPHQSGINHAKAERYCKAIASEGNVPIAPHLFYKNILDDADGEQRETGLEMAAALIAVCDEMRVYGDEWTEGMKRDIAVAAQLKKPIKNESKI